MRYSKKFIQAKLERFANQFGFKVIGRDTSHGKPGYVGAIALDFNSVYGGYQLMQICNEAGGQKTLTGLATRLNARELISWFEGAEYAHNLMMFEPSQR